MVLQHVLHSSALGLREELLNGDPIGSRQRGQAQEPGSICRCKDGQRQAGVVQVACKRMIFNGDGSRAGEPMPFAAALLLSTLECCSVSGPLECMT